MKFFIEISKTIKAGGNDEFEFAVSVSFPFLQNLAQCPCFPHFKVVVRVEILPRDFLQTPGNY